MPNSPVMDQFDRLLLQESHNFYGKTPSNTSTAGNTTQFHPLHASQQRSPIDSLCSVLNGNATVRRQLRNDIVRVVLANSGIPPHLVTEEDIGRILEALASELARVPTPVDERATISNELVWSALRDAPAGIDLIQRPHCNDGPIKMDLFRAGFQQRGSRVVAHQPLPLKQKERPRSPNVTKPHTLTGSNVTRSASSAFSADT